MSLHVSSVRTYLRKIIPTEVAVNLHWIRCKIAPNSLWNRTEFRCETAPNFAVKLCRISRFSRCEIADNSWFFDAFFAIFYEEIRGELRRNSMRRNSWGESRRIALRRIHETVSLHKIRVANADTINIVFHIRLPLSAMWYSLLESVLYKMKKAGIILKMFVFK